MNTRTFIRNVVLHALFAVTLAAGNAVADKKYGPGVTDTEIKLGQTMPYSGPASAYSNYGKVETGYFQMINDRGGINGRKIRLISLDDGFSPPKTVEQTRRLVEEEQVLMIFGSLGTAPNSAIMRYLNDRKVPQIFLATAAAKFYDPKNFPWTMGILFNYQQESALYAKYLLKTKPDAKVAILFQNDDFGKDFVKGFKEGLGEKAAKIIVAEASYEVTDPSIDSQVVMLQSSGADALLHATTSKFAAQAVRKIWDMGWRPTHFLTFPSSSIATVLTPAGVEKSVGDPLRQFGEGSERPAVGRGRRPERLPGVHEAVLSGRQRLRPAQPGRLHLRVHDDSRAHALRRRAHARELDAPGHQHAQPRGAVAASRDQGQYHLDRVPTDTPAAHAPLRWQALGVLR